MLSKNCFKSFSLLYLFVFILSVIIIPFANAIKVSADTNKKIIITFDSVPNTYSVDVAPLKYNKSFAYSYSFDDGLNDGYDPAFLYMNGGYSDLIGQYFGGLYFTDGAGNNVPFRGAYAFYSRNASYSDLHLTTPSYYTWTQLQEAVDAGWNVINHGYTSSTIPENDPNKVYYTGDPGGHAEGTLDYDYELSQLNVDVAANIDLKDNAGAVVGPLNMTHVILPNGDENYIQPAFDAGYRGVYSQSPSFTYDGSTVVAPQFTDVTENINATKYVMPRWFDTTEKYSISGDYPNGLTDRIDEIAADSTNGDYYWAQAFTHQVLKTTNPASVNGGMMWADFKDLMDYIEDNYGRYGDDSVWMAGVQEVYEYLITKQTAGISENLVGNQLTIEIDTTNVPTDFIFNALSFVVDADVAISNISYGTDFTYHTENTTTGLINVDWGVNSYSNNDITRVEALVSEAESSTKQSDINVATAYNNLLESAAAKAAFASRLGAIVVPPRVWYVNVKSAATEALVNSCLSTSTTFPPLTANWNNYCVGDTAIVGNNLPNLKDSDGLTSALTLTNTQAFKRGGLTSASTGNNSAIYPDAIINNNAQLYSSASSTPAQIELSGLEDYRTYDIKLYGYTSSATTTTERRYTQYTIGGVTQELEVAENNDPGDYVEFLNISPTNGEILINIAPKRSDWGYGLLNAMEIREDLLPAPTGLNYGADRSFTVDEAITPISPSVTGYGLSYSISPFLPVGLSIDPDTGVISGTPTEMAELENYTITAANSGGSVGYSLNLTVRGLDKRVTLAETLAAVLVNDAGVDVVNVGTTGTQPVLLSFSNGKPLAEINVDFSADRDWSAVTSDINLTLGKSYVHGLVSQAGAGSSFTLYVPIPDGKESSSVVICPGANSLAEVSLTCSNAQTMTLADAGVSQVTNSEGTFWKVAGLTGTGGLSILDSFAVRDTLDRLKVATASNHVIDSGTINGLLASGDTILLTLGSDWDLSSLAITDIDLLDDAVNVDLASSATTDTWGVAINDTLGTITFTAPTSGSGYMAADSVIQVLIGNNAVNGGSGTHQIVNPASVDVYEIAMLITNAEGEEYANFSIPIVDSDQVVVSGYVNTFINFDIDTGISDAVDCAFDACTTHENGSVAANYTVDLGELNSIAVNKSNATSVTHSDGNTGVINSIYFDLTTNAANGAIVYVSSANGGLQGEGANLITSVVDGNDIAVNSGAYGFQLTQEGSGNGTITRNSNCTLGNTFCSFPLTQKLVFSTESQPLDAGRLRMDIAAAASYTNNPGAYTDTLTFIAVPTY